MGNPLPLRRCLEGPVLPITGVLLFGGIGWGLDTSARTTRWFLPVGLLLGGAASFMYLIYIRYRTYRPSPLAGAAGAGDRKEPQVTSPGHRPRAGLRRPRRRRLRPAADLRLP